MAPDRNNVAKHLKQLSLAANAINKSFNTNSESGKGWLCLCKDCDYALQGTRNYTDRKRCWSCCRLKEEATNPPDFARLPAKFDRDRTANNVNTTEKEQKKREARARKREARQTVRAAADKVIQKPCTVAASPNPAKGKDEASAPVSIPATSQAPTRLQISEKLYEQIDLLVPEAIKVITDSLYQEIAPTVAEGKSPESILSKLIGERGPTAKIARRAELQADIVRYRDALVIFSPAGDSASEITDGIKLKLKAAEEALAKATKDAPSQDHELKAVQEARSSFEVAMQERLDRQQKGAAKALERKQARHLHIQKQRDQLKILEDGLSEMEKSNDEKHAAKQSMAMEADKKVLELFDIKIAALSSPQPQVPALTAGPQTAAGVNPLAVATPVPHEPETLAQIREYRLKIDELTAKLMSGASKVQAEFERAINLTEDELPIFKTPTKPQMPIYGALFKTMQQWSLRGANEPFDWETLDQLTGPDTKAWEVTVFVLGDLLKRWYPNGAPMADDVVPKQLALTLIQCLTKLITEFEQAETKDAITALTMDGYEMVRLGVKRLRKDA